MSSSVKKSTLMLVFLAMIILLSTIPACEGSAPKRQPAQGSSGRTRDAEIFLAGVSGMLADGDFAGGTTRSGYKAFIVGKSETSLILIYAPFLGNQAYLSVGQ
jgi:hypothetical protein